MTHERDEQVPRLRLGVDVPAAAPGSVSDLLRHARQDFGQDLRSVAAVLRIRPAYLEAIERGEFERLPGTTYAVGFLRTYADFLGLDAEAIVEQYKSESLHADQRPELVFPEPVSEGKIPGGAIILISVCLLGLAYGGWIYLSNQHGEVAELIPALPERLNELVQGAPPAAEGLSAPLQTAVAPDAASDAVAPAPTDGSEPAGLGEATAASPPAPLATEGESIDAPAAEAVEAPPPQLANLAAEPAPPASPAAAVPQSSPAPAVPAEPAGSASSGAASALAAVPPPARGSLLEQTVVIPAPPADADTVVIPSDAAPRVYGGSNDDARIVVHATQDSWVQIRDAQDALLLTRVLRAGDLYRVPNREGLTLLTGNAGGIELEVDGVRLPPLGPVGSVRRQIDLDADRLRDGTSVAR